MKFISTGRKYINFENDKTDDFDALIWAREILTEIAFNMERNSFLASEDYSLNATKEDVVYAIEILNLLTENTDCYIEYEKEN